MSEEQKKLLETQLWNIANELRGKMDADEFRDYILGFIFYKYLKNSWLRSISIPEFIDFHKSVIKSKSRNIYWIIHIKY